MILATATRTETLDRLTASVHDWLIDHALDRFLVEEPGPIDPQVLADWTEDAIRVGVDAELAAVLLIACRLADWERIAGWLTETRDEREGGAA